MAETTQIVRNPGPEDVPVKRGSGFTARHAGRNGDAQSAPMGSRPEQFKNLLEELLASLIDAVGASAGIVRLLSPHGATIQAVGSVGLSEELLELEGAARLDCETCGHILNVRGVHSASIRACKLSGHCIYAGHRVQSFITATIEASGTGKIPMGAVTLFFDKMDDPFEQTSKAVVTFSRMLASIIDHNKANQDARRVELLGERQAMANEIHDSLAQTLAYTRMRTTLLLESVRTGNELMVMKYAHEVNESVENSQKTVRELITNFRCPMNPAGLLHALQTLSAQFCQRHNISLEYVNRIANLELPIEYEIQVFHILQEALANVAIHSGATEARLSADRSGSGYVFTVDDNGSGGCGLGAPEGHYGMMIMRERAQRIGGNIEVASTQGLGTRVQLSFPEPGADWRVSGE